MLPESPRPPERSLPGLRPSCPGLSATHQAHGGGRRPRLPPPTRSSDVAPAGRIPLQNPQLRGTLKWGQKSIRLRVPTLPPGFAKAPRRPTPTSLSHPPRQGGTVHRLPQTPSGLGVRPRFCISSRGVSSTDVAVLARVGSRLRGLQFGTKTLLGALTPGGQFARPHAHHTAVNIPGLLGGARSILPVPGDSGSCQPPDRAANTPCAFLRGADAQPG